MFNFDQNPKIGKNIIFRKPKLQNFAYYFAPFLPKMRKTRTIFWRVFFILLSRIMEQISPGPRGYLSEFHNAGPTQLKGAGL